MSNKSKVAIPDEIVMQKIYSIRGKNVMLDRDLAELYEVETKRLKEQVRRNRDRFPEDFMIELTNEEHLELKELSSKQSRGQHSKYPPFAFTEHGVLMLASVLSSERAIKINIQIIRIFNQMREILLTHKDILLELESVKQQLSDHESKVSLIWEYLKQLEQSKQEEFEYKNRKTIGFNTEDK